MLKHSVEEKYGKGAVLEEEEESETDTDEDEDAMVSITLYLVTYVLHCHIPGYTQSFSHCFRKWNILIGPFLNP